MIINSSLTKKGTAPEPTGDYRVRFIDFDGTVLKDTGVNHGQAATAPTLPTHAHLTFQEWNNDFDVVTRDLDVGATYTTTDGKTRAFITLTAATGLDVSLNINKLDTSVMTVDWGDGSTPDTFDSFGSFNTGAHSYASYGDYEITFWISVGSGTYRLGHGGSASASLFGETSLKRCMLTKLYCSNEMITLLTYSLSQHNSLKHLSLSAGSTAGGTHTFFNNRAIEHISLPRSATSIGAYSFQGCSVLGTVAFPQTLVAINNDAFNASGLTRAVFGNVTVGTNAFFTNPSMQHIAVDSSISGAMFMNNLQTYTVDLGPNVATIGVNAFSGNARTLRYIIRATTPPSMSNVNAFGSINPLCKIFVPDDSVAAYKAATNWVSYADYIYPLSEA